MPVASVHRVPGQREDAPEGPLAEYVAVVDTIIATLAPRYGQAAAEHAAWQAVFRAAVSILTDTQICTEPMPRLLWETINNTGRNRPCNTCIEYMVVNTRRRNYGIEGDEEPEECAECPLANDRARERCVRTALAATAPRPDINYTHMQIDRTTHRIVRDIAERIPHTSTDTHALYALVAVIADTHTFADPHTLHAALAAIALSL
jgi:hypothetical protein